MWNSLGNIFNAPDGGGADRHKKGSGVRLPPGPTPPPGTQLPGSGAAAVGGHPAAPSGGFFNLPTASSTVNVSGFHPHPASLQSALPSAQAGASSSAPMPGAGGMFGGMSVAATPAAPVADVAVASSGFSFLTPAPMVTAGDVAVPAAPAAGGSSGFSFLGGGGGSGSSGSATLPSSASSTSVTTLPLAGASQPAPTSLGALTGVLAGPSNASAAVGAPLVPSLGSAALPPVVVQPAGVKKKKPAFRPGFAAREGESSEVAVGGVGAGNAGGAVPGMPSMLSGLVVHASGEDSPAGDASRSRTSSMTAAGAGTGGFGGMLAGLHVHADDSGDALADSVGAAAAAAVASVSQAPLFPLAPAAVESSAPASAFFLDGMTLAAPTSASAPVPSFLAGLTVAGSLVAAAPAAEPVPTPAVSFAQPQLALSGSGTGPSARLASALSELTGAARRARESVAAIKARLRAVANEDRRVADSIVTLRERLARVERQQNDAIRAEQFEAAEALNGTLEDVRAALVASEADKAAVAAERAALDAEQRAAFQGTLSDASQFAAALKRCVEERAELAAAFRREAQLRHATTRDRLATEAEQLRLKEDHVSRDTQLVAEENQQIARTITEQTTELDASVASLQVTHARLKAEVAELERQLEERRRQEREAAESLDTAESRIKAIRSKFDKQTKRLHAKKEAVDVESRECEAEARAIAQARKEYAIARKEDRVAEIAHLRQLRYGSLLQETVETLRGALALMGSLRAAWFSASAEAAAAGAALQAGLDASLAALRGTQSRKATLEAQVTVLKETIAGVDSKLPVLNEEKKVAVAERKFKEAGRLTAELKRLGDARDDAAKELSACLSEVDACDAAAAERQADIEAARSRLAAHEKAADFARMKSLREAVRAARRAIRAVGRLAADDARRAVDAAEVARTAVLEDVDLTEVGVAAADGPQPPDDAALGIALEEGGRTAAQAAALDVLLSERDFMLDELNQLCGKHGADLDLGAETDADAEASGAPAPVTVTTTPPQLAGEVAAVAAAAQAASQAAAAAAAQKVVDDERIAASEAAAVADAAAAVASASAAAEAAAAAAAAAVVEADAAVAAEASAASAESALADEAVPPPSLGSLRAALRSAVAAAAEKDAQQQACIAREDFEAADELQVDLDALAEQRAKLVAQAVALGASGDEAALLEDD